MLHFPKKKEKKILLILIDESLLANVQNIGFIYINYKQLCSRKDNTEKKGGKDRRTDGQWHILILQCRLVNRIFM